jgi:predicted ATP-grasp superfamily ATP-dependent carboligase
MVPLKILVTDGSSKHTLAAVRSLGQKGHRVTVVDKSLIAESFYSRYCNRRELVSRETKVPRQFALELRGILKKKKYDVLLPISWFSNYAVSKYHYCLDDLAQLAIPKFESMEIAANKDLTMEFARKIGLSVPETIPLVNETSLDDVGNKLGYPLVIKGSREAGTVTFPRNLEEMKDAYHMLKEQRPIAQQYIHGDGCGFFAAYNQGKCVAEFMHKRLREYPLSGGPSVAARAFYSPKLEELGKTLLDKLEWHGVAMVEFKQSTKDGKYYLMEVNPKFWGSLELAIHAGVDFPQIACDIAMGTASKSPQQRYRTNVSFRWPFPGELLYALEIGDYFGFIRNFFDRKYQDDIRLSDPVPLLFQLVSTARKVTRRKKR